MYCIQECPTRWGSMNKMIARILEQEEAIRCVLSSDRKTASLSLTWQDKEVLESMNKVLSRLSSLTDILSGDSYVTYLICCANACTAQQLHTQEL